MRWSTSILCLICGTAAAAQTYRWVDKDGEVHYSDQPAPGAEKIELPSAPNPGSVVPRNVPSLSPGTNPAASVRYTGCSVASPGAEEVLFNVREASVSLNVQPAGLQSGHRVRVTVNGAPVANWPSGSTGFQLVNLGRGSFTVAATIEDERGRIVCTAPPST
ncbi:MAG: DUF4124 domain-containing protein, partial [Proteobacteria bacterium]